MLRRVSASVSKRAAGCALYSSAPTVYNNYTVQGSSAVMSVKPLSARFRKVSAGETYAQTRNGTYLLQFVPRDPTNGAPMWKGAPRMIFGMMPHEVGRLALTPPTETITLTRQAQEDDSGNTTKPERALTISPDATNPGGVVMTFTDGSENCPISVEVRAEEYFVLKTLMFDSLGWVCGWQQAMDPTGFNPRTMVDSNPGYDA